MGQATCYLRHRNKLSSWSLLLILANLFNFEIGKKQKYNNLCFDVLASDNVNSGTEPTKVSGDTVATAKPPAPCPPVLLTQQSQSLPLINMSSERNTGGASFYFPDHASIIWVFFLRAVFRCDNGFGVQSVLTTCVNTQTPSRHGHLTNLCTCLLKVDVWLLVVWSPVIQGCRNSCTVY